MESKTCLITGICGFVGKHLADFFNKKGYSVYGFDKNSKSLKNTKIFELDILDKNGLNKLIADVKPNYIIHLASQSSVKDSWDDPKKTHDINVTGTKNLIEAVINNGLTNDCRFLFVSSAEIYGIPNKFPITEDHELKPVSPYGESRLEQEKLILDYEKKFGLNLVMARSFPHTGPGQANTFVLASFSYQIAKIENGFQKDVINVGNLEVERDFLDVRDVVKTYALMLENKNLKGVFNICSGFGIKLSTALETLISFSNKDINIKIDKTRFRPNDIPVLIGDCSKFYKKTGWKQTIDFKKTLEDLLNYWREQIKNQN